MQAWCRNWQFLTFLVDSRILPSSVAGEVYKVLRSFLQFDNNNRYSFMEKLFRFRAKLRYRILKTKYFGFIDEPWSLV